MTDVAAKPPILRVRSGARIGTSLLIRDAVVVGRDADITIEDREISRRHARIRSVGHALVIEDLGSSNGTWVNGQRVEEAVLRLGDVVTLGRTDFDVVAPPSDAASAPASEPPPTPARSEDELRPITALFADVVGSTGLGERLGADEISELIGECVSRMSEQVERFGGTVTAYMGDGIAAFFGLDRASEEDAERAARAALAIIAAVGRYSADVERAWDILDFNVRVGLNTGDAAVGALGSADRPNVALGDTTNVAARLQALAEPGTIAIGDDTSAQLRGRFLLEPLDEVQVKGRQAPVRAWRLLGALERPTVPDRRRLVGREAEVEQLRALVGDVGSGRGGVFFVVGDLGMGKTRLLAELEDVVGDRVALLQGFCAASPASPPYGPYTAILRSWVGAEPGEADSSVRAMLRLRLDELDGLPPGTVSGLALLLNLDVAGVDKRFAGDPSAAYVAWIEALAAARPLVIALDDVHWLEPSGAMLALNLAELATRTALAIVSTLRPERESHGWRLLRSACVAHPSRAKEIRLAPLPDGHAHELLDELAPDTDPLVRAEVIRQAEGNPLFIEQLLRASREGASFSAEGANRTVATARLLPPVLASVFVGRIDRLPPDVRRVAQHAAAVGRTFGRSLLARILDPASVETALPVLIEAGIVTERDPPPDQTWSFTHTLLRDAALSTLVRSRRREIFGRVAIAFEESVRDRLDEHLELLAYYYARSEDSAKALHYHERAADNALRLGAGTEASDRLRKAAQYAEELRDAGAVKRIAARRGIDA